MNILFYVALFSTKRVLFMVKSMKMFHILYPDAGR